MPYIVADLLCEQVITGDDLPDFPVGLRKRVEYLLCHRKEDRTA